MELEILRKKLSSFRGEGGRIRKVSNEMLLEVLNAWELWPGSARDFYNGIGCSRKGMGSLLGKAKRLKREGATMPFQEISVQGITETVNSENLTCDIEVQENNKIIRFRKVDLLIEYLKKAS